MLAGGLGEQLVDDLVEQYERVVGGVKLELPQRRQEGRVASFRAHPPQRLRFRHQAVAGERPLPAGRDVDDEFADADVAHGLQAQQRFQQLGRGQLPRPGAQPLKIRQQLARGDVQQCPEALALAGAEGDRERRVQPLGGLVARRSNQPGEHARARQQHLRVDQASGREIEQHTRALRGRPRARV